MPIDAAALRQAAAAILPDGIHVAELPDGESVARREVAKLLGAVAQAMRTLEGSPTVR